MKVSAEGAKAAAFAEELGLMRSARHQDRDYFLELGRSGERGADARRAIGPEVHLWQTCALIVAEGELKEGWAMGTTTNSSWDVAVVSGRVTAKGLGG